MMYPHIRIAQLADIPAIQQISKSFKNELGFVMRLALERAVCKHELYVAECNSVVVGFVNWHTRRDGWRTIYEIAVCPEFHGQGIGRQLLYAVPCPLRLKCTTDNTKANAFYRGAGMQLTAVESGRKRALNVWEMRILAVLCAGNNTRFPEVARQSGMAYGSRHDDQIRAWPFMLDIDFHRYEYLQTDEERRAFWREYMDVVHQYRPCMAMAADYFQFASSTTLLNEQLDELKTVGILRVMVCPKFDGAVKHIPDWCIVAVSVPSDYAGFMPELSELKGRKIHLLGGSPVKQREWILRLNSVATVISYDGNAHTANASKGGYWKDGRWQFDKQSFDYYDLCQLSGKNIVTSMNEAARWKQLGLWEAA